MSKDCPKREDFLLYCDPCTEPLCGDFIEPGCPPVPCPADTPRGQHQRQQNPLVVGGRPIGTVDTGFHLAPNPYHWDYPQLGHLGATQIHPLHYWQHRRMQKRRRRFNRF